MRTCSCRLQIASAAAMAVALTVCSSARADEPTDFYQGKSITLYLGYPPSGAYDLYARVIARHMSRLLGRDGASYDPGRVPLDWQRQQ